MNWLTNFVRPKLQALVNKSDIPDNLWTRCQGCGQLLFQRDLEKNFSVCRHCNHHLRMDGPTRLKSLFDDETYTLIDVPEVPVNPIKFRDLKKYSDRLKDAQQRTKTKDAVLVAKGPIDGHKAVVAVFDFAFMGGSMGTAVGEALVTAANTAISMAAPLIVIPSSGGARMQEGILSLMQMPRITIAISRVKEAKLPYITVLADPTAGGVTASFAMLGDITLTEPGAIICFAGARVIQQTIGEKLPPNFQKSEYLLDHGMVDRIVPRAQLKSTLANLIGLLTKH